MRNIVRSLRVVLVFMAMLFANMAQAMEIQKFDKMSDADQKEYVSELVEGAQRCCARTDAWSSPSKSQGSSRRKLQTVTFPIGMTHLFIALPKARVAAI